MAKLQRKKKNKVRRKAPDTFADRRSEEDFCAKQMTPGAKKEVVDQVWDLAQPLCDSQGLELVHIEYQREPAGRILRTYIDKPGGITLEDCVHFSRQLGDLLDVYLDSENAYNLEVSSPGTDRPLGRIEDFKRFKGSMARIKTVQPLNGQKNFKGILLGISKENIKLRVSDNRIVEIAFVNIAKARLVDYSGEDRCS